MPDTFNRVHLSDQEFLDSIFSTKGLPGYYAVRWANKQEKPTRRCAARDLLKRLDLSQENYISYSYVLFGDTGGQSDEDVEFIEAVCIDLDAKHQPGGVATPEQIQKVCKLIPWGIITVANGVQVSLRPGSELWEKNVADIVALGDYLAVETGLDFDRGCQICTDGSAAAHRNHPFRAPGWAKKAGRKVIFLAPFGAQLMGDTKQVVEALGLTPPMVLPMKEGKGKKKAKDDNKKTDREEDGTTQPNPDGGMYSVSGLRPNLDGGSLAEERQEFRQILAFWSEGVYAQNRPRAEVEAEILAMKWEFHKASSLAKTLPNLKVYNTSDSGQLSEEEWKAVCADLEPLQMWVGPKSAKRVKMQQTGTLRANRAWSFEWLYWFKHAPAWKLTFEEALTAFWNWPNFETIREMSLAALKTVEAVEEDLKVCWDRWSDASPTVSKEHLDEIARAIHAMGTFTRSEIQEKLGLSERLVQRGLKALLAMGRIEQKGNGRSTSYALPGVTSQVPAEPAEPAPLKRKFKSTPTTRPMPPEFEAIFEMALEGAGHGHSPTGCPSQQIKDKARFRRLYEEVFLSVSCDGKGEFKGPSISRLYAFLATKVPSGFCPTIAYLQYKGDDLLSDVVVEKPLSADDLTDGGELFPQLRDSADIEIVENEGGAVLKDFGSLAIKYAAENIERVLQPSELAAVMRKLDRQPWLRASADSLMMLNEMGYEKLRHWFSEQIGEELKSLYLGPKPKRGGKPFAVMVRGKQLEIHTVGTVWSGRKNLALAKGR